MFSVYAALPQIYVERVLLDYLHLVVNSRNELSLSRVLNVPDRGLGHKAFTHLKHEAHTKGVSMYHVSLYTATPLIYSCLATYTHCQAA